MNISMEFTKLHAMSDDDLVLYFAERGTPLEMDIDLRDLMYGEQQAARSGLSFPRPAGTADCKLPARKDEPCPECKSIRVSR